MPITVRQTPVGALGRLAVRAGQARGQQLRMGRDIQLTSMAMAAEDRAAQIGMAASDRTFALQQAATAQMERQRPAGPDTLVQRRRSRKLISEAKAAGIYTPAQIKQAQVFSNLGDESAVRSILSKLPEPTARRRELQSQLSAITEIGTRETSEIQKQLDTIKRQLGLRFTPETQQLLMERPDYMATVDQETQDLLTQQQQLEEQKAMIAERTAQVTQGLRFGLSIPEQAELKSKQEAAITKQEDIRYKRLVEQTREAGKISEREELTIDVMRDRERGRRTLINREITRLSKDLFPSEDEADDPVKYAERVAPIQEQIRMLKLQQTATYGAEKARIEEFLRATGQKKADVPEFYTTPDGKRYRFTGEYRDGKPDYEPAE